MAYEYPVDLDVERKFEVYDIKWVIENFTLATCDRKWSIQSPVFSVRGFHVTKWLMTLAPSSSVHNANFVDFALKRCDSDGGPDSVIVEYRVKISISQNNEEIVINRLGRFGMGAQYKESITNLKNSIEMIKSFESDRVTIRCKMIVCSENKEFARCPHNGKSCLSENLFDLYLNGHCWDLKLKIGDKDIKAHKAIVCTRIEELNHLLELSKVETEGDREIEVIDVSHIDHEAMEKIVEYAYSGDLKHVLGEPSLAMLESVQLLGIHHLKNVYAAKELTLRTRLDAPETRFTWIIDDFFDQDGIPLVSPELIDDFSATWRLRIYPESRICSDYFTVQAHNVEEVELGNVCVELAIIDECDRPVFTKLLRRAAGDRTLLQVEKFIRRSTVRNLLIGNALRFVLTLKLATGEMRSCIEKEDITVISNSRKTDSFGLLSQGMRYLFKKSDFCDILLECDNESYPVHKSIVSFRCGFLSNLFNNETNRDGRVTVNGIDPGILYLLLMYIYGGVIVETGDNRKVVDLRETAIRWNLPLLTELCDEFLQMNVDNRM